MTPNEVNAVVKAVTFKRQTTINDGLMLQHTLAILVSHAIGGSSHFPKEPPQVDLLKGKGSSTQSTPPITGEAALELYNKMAGDAVNSTKRKKRKQTSAGYITDKGVYA